MKIRIKKCLGITKATCQSGNLNLTNNPLMVTCLTCQGLISEQLAINLAVQHSCSLKPQLSYSEYNFRGTEKNGRSVRNRKGGLEYAR